MGAWIDTNDTCSSGEKNHTASHTGTGFKYNISVHIKQQCNKDLQCVEDITSAKWASYRPKMLSAMQILTAISKHSCVYLHCKAVSKAARLCRGSPVIISKPSVNSNWIYSPETLNLGQNHRFFVPGDLEICNWHCNKANLRDLIAATGLVILLKLDLNRRFFSPCDLEIWWMTPKNNRAPLLCYFKLFASFRSHWWIQTGVTVWKRLIWVKIDAFFLPCDLEIWRMTFKNNRAPPLCYFKLCASFRNHWWIQTGVTVRKRPIWVKCYAF